jgi:putative (di)nucleoside polyphosphate hydrolase
VIDSDGFRPNVGIVLANEQGQVLWARRVGQSAWQFPQGGIHEGESPEAALYRELYEEVGLREDDVSLLACTRGWLRYRLPQRLIRRDNKPLCIGQAEFDHWQWVSYWYPLGQVVAFKREVYRRAMKELAPRHARLVKDAVSGELQ